MTLNEGTNVEITLPEVIEPNYQLPDPALMQIYRDRNSRTIWMLGEVGDSTYDWIDFIIDVNREDTQKGIPIERRKPIKCLIANYGGSVEAANTLIDIIKLSKTPVYGMAIGMCASAASKIYLACHKRFALPSSVFIFHQGSCSGISGNYSEVQQFMDDYKIEIDKLTEFYKKHTSYDPQLIEEKLSEGDWYIRVPEALENGVVDALVEDIEQLI